jgi:molecular chaperone HscB
MNLLANYFDLFGLPVRFALDRVMLDKAYHDLQGRVHPDRFAAASEVDQRVSMQWATRANEAYNALRKPLSRARYFLELHGVDLATESNTAMPVDFLMAQMEWREAVEEAEHGNDHHELEALHHRLRAELESRYEALGLLLDAASNLQKNRDDAASEVRKLMFLEKMLQEIDDAIADLEEKM